MRTYMAINRRCVYKGINATSIDSQIVCMLSERAEEKKYKDTAFLKFFSKMLLALKLLVQ